jgi:hypothetical protein
MHAAAAAVPRLSVADAEVSFCCLKQDDIAEINGRRLINRR